MSEHNSDNHNEPWLDELYQSGKDTLPPDDLDDSILELAAKKTNTPVWRKLSAPLATAAVLMLTVGVFVNQSTNDSEFLATPAISNQTATKPAPQDSAPASQTEDMITASEMKQQTASSGSAHESELRQRDAEEYAVKDDVEFDAVNGAPPAPVAPAAAPPSVPAEIEPRRQIEEIVVTATRRESVAADVPLTRFEEKEQEVAGFAKRRASAGQQRAAQIASIADDAVAESAYRSELACEAENLNCHTQVEHPECTKPYLFDGQYDVDISIDAVHYLADESAHALTCVDNDWHTRRIIQD